MTIVDICKSQFNLRIYDEGVARIKKVLQLLSEEDVWFRPNDESNSIGHLILHLCGNVTQWIGSGIGQRADDRQRDAEFTTNRQYRKIELVEKLDSLRSITDEALLSIATEEDLVEKRTVQGFSETKMSILIHVIEHFSYHVGQIAVIAKYLKATDLGFYEGLDLDITG